MGYIYNRILEGQVQPGNQLSEHILMNFQSRLRPPKLQVVHCGPVLDYFNQETPPEESFLIRDLPNLIPRLGMFFLERGDALYLPVASFHDPEARAEEDWRVGTWEFASLCRRIDLWDTRETDSEVENVREILSQHCGKQAMESEVRWGLQIVMFAVRPGEEFVRGPLVRWILGLRTNGTVYKLPKKQREMLVTIPLLGSDEDDYAWQRDYQGEASLYLTRTGFVLTTLNSAKTKFLPDNEGRIYCSDLDIEGLKRSLDAAGAKERKLSTALLIRRNEFQEPPI